MTNKFDRGRRVRKLTLPLKDKLGTILRLRGTVFLSQKCIAGIGKGDLLWEISLDDAEGSIYCFEDELELAE